MRLTKKQNGYTIVETLIVLAVTGAMFTATVIMVRGQISRYQFKDATYTAQQRVQGVLNDVSTGYFSLANSTTASCNSGSASQAGDSNCVYVGKRLTISSTGQLTSYPLIADKDSPSPIGAPVTNLIELNNPENINLPGSVDYSSPTTGNVLVLYTNYPSTGAISYSGGAQSVGVFGVDGSGKVAQLVAGKVVCMVSGGKKAKLTIGTSSALNVELSYTPTASECP